MVVLGHTGPVFCSGMDLKESPRRGGRPTRASTRCPRSWRIWTAPTPVVAKVGGPARAGGVGLVAACDIAVAVDAATFAFSEVRIGVVPAVISETVLPGLLPRAAHELFVTGETFDAARAVDVGLRQAGGAAEELDDEVARYVGMPRSACPGRSRRRRRCCVPSARPALEDSGRRDARAVGLALRGRGGPAGHARCSPRSAGRARPWGS